ncbi:MAG: histidine triad nucleotide-binding protein [Gammaproteobacteria bacterium]|nr:histidine triad nucleotide-binding protein [Gammaproteobacteria bacterium]
MDCIFCDISNGKMNANIIYQDDHVLAFSDINPKAPEHYLIIPKKHIATLNDANKDDQALLGHIMLTAQQLANKHGFSEAGYRIAMNCNKAGGQDVFHIHLHLLGGRQMTWPPG